MLVKCCKSRELPVIHSASASGANSCAAIVSEPTILVTVNAIVLNRSVTLISVL